MKSQEQGTELEEHTSSRLVLEDEDIDGLDATDSNPFLANNQDEKHHSPWTWPKINRINLVAGVSKKRIRLALVACFILLLEIAAIARYQTATLKKIVDFTTGALSDSVSIGTSTRTKPGTAWQGFQNIDTLFVFGDSWSISDYQNPALVVVEPSKEPLSYPPDWTNTTTIRYPHFLTHKYNQSRITTWGFAHGGSVVDYKYVKGYNEQHTLLYQIVLWWQRFTVIENDTLIPRLWNAERSLFSFFFGINDVFLGYPVLDKLDGIFESYQTVLEQLYQNAGARNFLLINCIPLEYTPIVRQDPEKKADIGIHVVEFNKRVYGMAANLTRKWEDITVFVFDLHTWMLEILDDPQSDASTAVYKNVTDPCLSPERRLTGPEWTQEELAKCDPPADMNYLWMDFLHATSPLHEGITVRLLNLLQGQTLVSS